MAGLLGDKDSLREVVAILRRFVRISIDRKLSSGREESSRERAESTSVRYVGYS